MKQFFVVLIVALCVAFVGCETLMGPTPLLTTTTVAPDGTSTTITKVDQETLTARNAQMQLAFEMFKESVNLIGDTVEKNKKVDEWDKKVADWNKAETADKAIGAADKILEWMLDGFVGKSPPPSDVDDSAKAKASSALVPEHPS